MSDNLRERIEEIDFRDCGDFQLGDDDTIRDCYKCGRKIQLCSNCHYDHHLISKTDALVSLFKEFGLSVIGEDFDEEVYQGEQAPAIDENAIMMNDLKKQQRLVLEEVCK